MSARRWWTVPLLLAVALAAVAGEERAGEVAGDRVRIRSGPGTKHAILARLSEGDLVVVAGEEGRWLRVRIPGGFACYVHSSLVRREEDGTGVVTATRVLLRPTAGKEMLPLETVLDRGEVVTVLGEEGEWLRVIPPERTHLFVFADLVRDLGPAGEYRAALERAGRGRRKALLASRSPEEERRKEEARQKRFRDEVLDAGAKVLAGEGEAGKLAGRLREISLESDDDLTRGYANALLALLDLRSDAERLREELENAKDASKEALADLEERAEAAEKRYREALDRARALEEQRRRPFRGIGVVERRGDGFVLVEEGRVRFRIESERFRLADYVGKRVGVNGSLVPAAGESGGKVLRVEKLEILLVKPGRR